MSTLAPTRGPGLRRRAWVEPVMGTAASLHVRSVDPWDPEVEAAVRRAFAHLHRAERVLSTWRSDSDLLRLQHGESDDVHAWVADVVELALEAEDRTDGLFSAWRSRAGGRTAFDPTGLVKGWATAGAAEHLALVPGLSFCLGVGGDVTAGTGPGVGPDAPDWRVGVADPGGREGVVDVVAVRRAAVATSGAAERGAHVSDPRSGRLVDRPGSVTVVGPDLTWADVWATAGWVDPRRASRLLSRRDPEYRLLRH